MVLTLSELLRIYLKKLVDLPSFQRLHRHLAKQLARNMLCHGLEARNQTTHIKTCTPASKSSHALVPIEYESSNRVGGGFGAARPFWGMDIGFVQVRA